MPVLLFDRGQPSPQNHTNCPTWPPLWEHLRESKWELGLSDSESLSFCDMATQLLGWGHGERSFELVPAYIKAFLGIALKEETSALLPVSKEALCLTPPEVVIYKRRDY
jgi:hypothetical protein